MPKTKTQEKKIIFEELSNCCKHKMVTLCFDVRMYGLPCDAERCPIWSNLDDDAVKEKPWCTESDIGYEKIITTADVEYNA